MKQQALLLAIGLLTVVPGIALAKPWLTKDGDCMACHGQPQPGLIEVVGHQGFADPQERSGVPDGGLLKLYSVMPGQLKPIYAQVRDLQPGDVYVVALTGLNAFGVAAGTTLSYSPDCDWAEWWSSGNFTDTGVGQTWVSDPAQPARYDLTVAADAPADYYELILRVAGKHADTGQVFYGEERFYLLAGASPPKARADFDGDGDVDQSDYAHLQVCLSGADAAQTIPTCQDAKLDSDADVDQDDVLAFQRCMTGEKQPADVNCQ